MARTRRNLASLTAAANAAAAAALATPPPAGEIGALCWYDGIDGWHMPAADVQDAWRAAGLDPDADLPAAPGWDCAFGRAIGAVNASLGRDKKYRLERAGVGTNGEQRWNVAQFARNGVVTMDDLGTVALPRWGAPYVERDDGQGIAAAVVHRTREAFEVYTSDDVRIGITNLFARWHAIKGRLKAPTILYYLTPQALPTIDALTIAVESIGWGTIGQFEGKDSARTQKTSVRVVNSGLEESLNDFAARIAKFTDPTTKTRARTIEATIEEAQALARDASLYRAILGSAVESIDGKLATVQAELRRALGFADASEEETAA